jgi:hypothetical protein
LSKYPDNLPTLPTPNFCFIPKTTKTAISIKNRDRYNLENPPSQTTHDRQRTTPKKRIADRATISEEDIYQRYGISV